MAHGLPTHVPQWMRMLVYFPSQMVGHTKIYVFFHGLLSPAGSQTFSSCVSDQDKGFFCSSQAGAWAQCDSNKCPLDIQGYFDLIRIWSKVSFVGCFIETDISYWGSDILSRGSIENQDECAELCASTNGGLFWTYIVGDKQCYVKGSAEGRTSLDGRISGNVACGGATFI